MSVSNKPTPAVDSSSLRAVGMGMVASLFFSLTFVLNRALVVKGGHWGWAASLRYVFTLLIVGAFVHFKGGLGELPAEIKRHPWPWLIWSAIGFGFFGLFLTLASVTGPAWLVAGGFQFTVIAGPLLAPLIYKDDRRRIAPLTIVAGAIILTGVFSMQLSRATAVSFSAVAGSVASIFTAAFLYPLGNRKLMLHLEGCRAKITTSQRVLGMTLLSMVVHIPLALVTLVLYGPPTSTETMLGAGAAISSGAIATVIFYRATEIVRRNRVSLAAVEAMQSGALLFAMVLGVVFLGESWPHGMAAVGAAMVLGGIVMFTLLSAARR